MPPSAPVLREQKRAARVDNAAIGIVERAAFDRAATYRRVMGSCPDCSMAKPDHLPIRVASGSRSVCGLQSSSVPHGTMIVELRGCYAARVDRANCVVQSGFHTEPDPAWRAPPASCPARA